MHHLTLVLVTTATVLAGSVWHLPALQTVRAGQDRPGSARLKATACLLGWGSGLVLAGALLLARSALPGLLALAAGEVLATELGLLGVLARRRERRTEDVVWTELGCPPKPGGTGSVRRLVLGWTLAVASAGSPSVALLIATGHREPALLLATGLSAAALAAVGALTVQRRLDAHAPGNA